MNRSGGETDRLNETRAELSDGELAVAIAAGHEAALRNLIARYDRLVRYSIFRCAPDRGVNDPHWIDGISSQVWSSIVQTIRQNRRDAPRSLRAYVIGVSRNITISELRKATAAKRAPALSIDEAVTAYDPSAVDPAEYAERLEILDALRHCVDLLASDHALLVEQLPVILDRRWREASAVLGLPESTLRSRWKQVLEQLRSCVEGKTGKDFARDQS